MKTAKLGAIFLISIMALAGVGAGYAAWTDTITIDGTVNTGDVDLDIVALSSTYVYKVPDHGIITLYELKDLQDNVLRQYVYETNTWYWPGNLWLEPEGSILVASSVATPGTNDNEIIATATNLFPCIYFGVDALLHYDGSIPVRISKAWIETTDQWLLYLIGLGEAGVSVFTCEADGSNPVEIPHDQVLGYQLHDCNYIMVIIWIHILQDDFYMTVEQASFTGKLEVIQWNEY